MNMLLESLREATEHSHVANDKKQHEKWFANILKSNGFSSKQLSDTTLTNEDVRSQRTFYNSNQSRFYIEQPLGTQSTPDFLVFENNQIFYVELKSSSDDKITWNSGYPHPGYIYLFSSGKHNSQTVFLGEDAWGVKTTKELLEYAELMKNMASIFNERRNSTLWKMSLVYYWRKFFARFSNKKEDSNTSLLEWPTIAGLKSKNKSKLLEFASKIGVEDLSMSDKKTEILKKIESHRPNEPVVQDVKYLQSFYCRNMYNDNEKYYGRSQRLECEKRVINLLSANISEVNDVAAK